MPTETKIGFQQDLLRSDLYTKFHQLKKMCDLKSIHLNKGIILNMDISNNVITGYFTNK